MKNHFENLATQYCEAQTEENYEKFAEAVKEIGDRVRKEYNVPIADNVFNKIHSHIMADTNPDELLDGDITRYYIKCFKNQFSTATRGDRIHFNILAEIYANDKSEKNFNKLYMELRHIGMAYTFGLTVERDDYESITTDLAMRLKNNFDKLHQEKKSLLSYCIMCFKTKYYSLLKKYNKRVLQSDLIFKGSDSDVDMFEKVIVDNTDQEEENNEIFNELHNDGRLQLDRFYQILEDEFADGDIELMRDIFTPREDIETNNAFVWQSPELIMEKYGITGRTTVSAKRTRAVAKIKKILEREMKLSEMSDGIFDNAECFNSSGEMIKIVDGKIKETELKTKSGLIIKTIKEGDTEIVQKFYQNGKLKESGRKISNKRIGEWLFYHQNGILEGRINYDNEMRFVMFDETGNGEAMGKLK